MKKSLTLFAALLIVCNIEAQLQVDYSGKVALGATSTSTNSKVFAGTPYSGTYVSNSTIGFHANSETSTSPYCIGIRGSSNSSYSITARSIAIQGVANGGTSGYLYGIIGGLGNSTLNGAGVFGTLSNTEGLYIGGRYAGYFDGAVRIDGIATINSIVTPSDSRLKENIMSLNDCYTLDKVLRMNVVKYNYRKYPVGAKSMKEDECVINNGTDDIHYGLLAQELQEIYPDLVKEGQDGYLGVNYTELVPILIQAIQELKKEINDLRNANNMNLGDPTFSNTPNSGNPYNSYSNIIVNGYKIGKKQF